MNINNTCVKCEIIFSNDIDVKKKTNRKLEPLDLGFEDTLICANCLKILYQGKLISEARWKKSKFNKQKNLSNENYQAYNLF
tara:strand:- start:74 stop:319 length:246 start_codon:yes stop_codon:yes gene_type:complete